MAHGLMSDTAHGGYKGVPRKGATRETSGEKTKRHEVGGEKKCEKTGFRSKKRRDLLSLKEKSTFKKRKASKLGAKILTDRGLTVQPPDGGVQRPKKSEVLLFTKAYLSPRKVTRSHRQEGKVQVREVPKMCQNQTWRPVLWREKMGG